MIHDLHRPDLRRAARALLAAGPALATLLAAAPVAARGDEAPPATEGRTLTLAQALAELDAQNLTLAQVRTRADEAKAIVYQAYTPLLPTLAATGSFVRNSDEAKAAFSQIFSAIPIIPPSVIEKLPGDLVIQPLQAFSGAAVLKVPVLVPSAWFDLAAARQGVAVAEAVTETTRLQLRAGLAQAAWGAWAAEQMIEAAERAIATAADHAASAERAVGAGIGEPLAVMRARTEVVKRQSDLVQARAGLARARLAVGILLGKAEPVRVSLAPPDAPAAVDLRGLVAEALGARPELKVQAAQQRAVELQADSARWRLAPQLTATGSAFASDVPYPTGKNEGWRVSVDLSWVLFDGGYRYGKRRQAVAQLAATRAQTAAQRLDIARDVEDSARDVDVARERIRLAEQQRRLADDAASTAKRSFEAGVATALDVRDANDRLYLADVGLADARSRLGMAQVALLKALGRTP